MAAGGYRMYFSELRDNPSNPATAVKSATSPDQLTWTMDPGVRIGPGAPAGIPGGNPNVIVRADGVRMIYLSSTDPSTGQGIHPVRLR
jgi:hypothetical protein